MVLLSLENRIHEIFRQIGKYLYGGMGHLIVKCSHGCSGKVLRIDCDFDEFEQIVQIFRSQQTKLGEMYSWVNVVEWVLASSAKSGRDRRSAA